jgi:hypothetical protein
MLQRKRSELKDPFLRDFEARRRRIGRDAGRSPGLRCGGGRFPRGGEFDASTDSISNPEMPLAAPAE